MRPLKFPNSGIKAKGWPATAMPPAGVAGHGQPPCRGGWLRGQLLAKGGCATCGQAARGGCLRRAHKGRPPTASSQGVASPASRGDDSGAVKAKRARASFLKKMIMPLRI
ncbi:hypothetical protein BHE74_00057327 [Ensete ventricosum]|nr:hypothetical protein BHE74_00057327 [Ensete ventricosum]